MMGVKKPEVLPVTEDEIKLLLEQGVELGAFEKEEPELVTRVFRLADMDVGDIMTNRTQVDWLDVEDPEATMMQELVASITITCLSDEALWMTSSAWFQSVKSFRNIMKIFAVRNRRPCRLS